jgi:hypothetical protein
MRGIQTDQAVLAGGEAGFPESLCSIEKILRARVRACTGCW